MFIFLCAAIGLVLVLADMQVEILKPESGGGNVSEHLYNRTLPSYYAADWLKMMPPAHALHCLYPKYLRNIFYNGKNRQHAILSYVMSVSTPQQVRS